MNKTPDHAFILAAGRGTRLRPYTDDRPKPLVRVWGKPLIDHVLERLTDAGVTHITVNSYYKADMLEAHLAQCMSPPILTISREKELLDTGGGIKNALMTMESGPFYVVSGDSLWLDGPGRRALERLADAWNPDDMDLLLLLQPLTRMTLTKGAGDYDLTPNGKAIRALDKSGAYMWTSIRICTSALFDNSPAGPFSFLELMDRAQEKGRLYGLVHDGDWYHISTPDDLEAVNESAP